MYGTRTMTQPMRQNRVGSAGRLFLWRVEVGRDQIMSGNGSDASRRFGSAEQAVVVKALDKGASVAAAARAAGFCVSTLYNARERCAVFRDAWDAAVEASGRPRLGADRKSVV